MTRLLAVSTSMLLALCVARSAIASPPVDEPDFGPWCEAARTLVASSSTLFMIRDSETDQVVGVVPMSGGADGPVRQIVPEIEINHTWVGDLVIRLEYTDCGTGEVLYGTNLVCRPRGVEDEDNVPCGGSAGFGCDGNFGRSKLDYPQPASQRYWFADESTNILDNGACAPVLGSGCYQPSPGGNLAGFEGLPRGGCWRLLASDWKIGDVGSITSWGVWELDPLSTPAARPTWGELKTIYR